jgi:CMP-N,N'-diacetyllegionaminic acid synthase
MKRDFEKLGNENRAATLVTICARGGSKGIPGKNIRPLNGLPLIAYTIKTATEIAKSIDADVILSTDSTEIKSVAANYGLRTEYVRPEHLANDRAGKIDAIVDALAFSENSWGRQYDYVIDLDVTSPIRTQGDVLKALDQLKSIPDALNIFSVSPANRNPYFNMVELDANGYAQVVKNTGNIKSRQAAPRVYDMNASFYIFRKRFFEEGCRVSTTPKSLAYVMDHLCFDLDHEIDFLFMDYLVRENIIGL